MTVCGQERFFPVDFLTEGSHFLQGGNTLTLQCEGTLMKLLTQGQHHQKTLEQACEGAMTTLSGDFGFSNGNKMTFLYHEFQ